MADLTGFDANDVEPQDDFEPLPPGEYTVMITDSTWKTSKAGSEYLSLTFEVVDGPKKSRLLWEILNLKHPTQKVAEIAARTLSAICRACGVMVPMDSEALHNLPMVAKVIIEEGKGDYGPKNKIKSYRACGKAIAAPKQSSGEAAPWRQNVAEPEAAPQKAFPWLKGGKK